MSKNSNSENLQVPNNSPVEENKYVVIQENSGVENESWLYFIRFQGNEEALRHLEKQFESVDWEPTEDLSVFTIDLEHFVSEKTAKEMTKIDLNSYFYRKFDGKLRMIDFRLKNKYDTLRKMEKINDLIGEGRIDEWVDGEDVDLDSNSDAPNRSSSSSSDDEEKSNSSSDSSSSEEDNKRKKKKRGELPKVAKQQIPRIAKFRQKKQIKKYFINYKFIKRSKMNFIKINKKN